jgi:hypothetical protein
MCVPEANAEKGNLSFRAESPFYYARGFAQQTGCDLAVPNGAGHGIGDVLVFTPLVEAYARRLGRPLRLLSAPFDVAVGVVEGEDLFPIWRNNPFVSSIIDARSLGASAVHLLDQEKDNCCQFNHIIENICVNYGVRPRALRPSIYLTAAEQGWGLDQLRDLPRPVVCLHPGGKTASPPQSPWHHKKWRALIAGCRDIATFIQIGKPDYDQRDLGIKMLLTTVRQMFALIWASDCFLGFDSGPMHAATAFEKPVLALWDAQQKLTAEESWQTGFSPAVVLRWGYPQNRNLMILGERQDELLDQVEVWLRTTCGAFAWFPYSRLNR